MSKLKSIEEIIEKSKEIKDLLKKPDHLNTILKISEEIISALKQGGKLIVFGNGGSAADAQHMVCEFVGRFKKERKALPAISLATNTSSITAISNDYNYGDSFKRQVDALAGPNDIVFGISTSGNAPNVIAALEQAKIKNATTVALTGKGGGKISGICDLSLIVPSNDTPRIQEAHILVIHILCELVEDALS